jgi:NAD(P)-dependent dehydrogenase (short-subunit alcohol dehydrogenase family)
MKPMITKVEDLFAVKHRARFFAKKAVVAELKAKGVRVTLVRPAEINTQANAYLEQHPELYDKAFASFEKPRR